MEPQRITHVTASVSTFGGGIPEALSSLAAKQAKLGYDVTAVGHKDSGEDINGWPGSSLTALPARALPWMTWAPEMGRTLSSLAPSIIHTHGLWTQASITVPAYSSRNQRPYVVSPHGMLDEWALKRSMLKKRLASLAFEKRHLSQASCLHALCKPEAEAIRSYGVNAPIAIVPNGVDLPALPPNGKEQKTRKTLLFLGRIHPKKGLANAVQAFAKAEVDDDWMFVIAGWDQLNHLEELMDLCGELKIPHKSIPLGEFLNKPDTTSSIVFVGPAFGEEKHLLFQKADVFVLPSFSEGMPMSVLEAWSYQLPVVLTPHCNLPQGVSAEAAVETENDVHALAQTFKHFLKSDPKTLNLMGTNGRALVEARFTWSRIANDMIEMYHWILGEAPRPEFIVSE